MKRKKSKLLAFSLLALCFACLAFGVYALKNATLTVSGTIGFTAHDCMVEVEAYIEGDGLTEAGVTATDGHPSEERALNFKSGTNVVTVGGATEEEWEKLGEINDTIYFTDLTDTGAPAPITMTFKVTNLSVYDVYARIANVIDLKEKGVTVVVTEGDQIMQEANDSEEDVTDETTLTAVFTLDTTKVTDAGLSEGFELKLDFGKYVAPTGGEEGGEETEDRIVYNDFEFINEEGVYTLVKYNGTDTVVNLPETAPDGSSDYILGKFFDTTDEYEAFMTDNGNIPEDGSAQDIMMQKFLNYGPFAFNSTVTEVNVPANVTKIGIAFTGAQALTTINFADGSKLKELGTFSFGATGTSLQTITLPEGLEIIGVESFNSSAVSVVNLPNSVKEIRTGAFGYASNLTQINIPTSLEVLGDRAFANSFAEGNEANLVIPATVKSVGDSVFYICNVSKVTVPYSEGTELPVGWSENWNSDYTGTVIYQ